MWVWSEGSFLNLDQAERLTVVDAGRDGLVELRAVLADGRSPLLYRADPRKVAEAFRALGWARHSGETFVEFGDLMARFLATEAQAPEGRRRPSWDGPLEGVESLFEPLYPVMDAQGE